MFMYQWKNTTFSHNQPITSVCGVNIYDQRFYLAIYHQRNRFKSEFRFSLQNVIFSANGFQLNTSKNVRPPWSNTMPPKDHRAYLAPFSHVMIVAAPQRSLTQFDFRICYYGFRGRDRLLLRSSQCVLYHILSFMIYAMDIRKSVVHEFQREAQHASSIRPMIDRYT